MQLVYNILILIKQVSNSFSDFFFYMITKLQPFFPKDVYFLRDTDSKYTELVDAYSLFCYMVENNYKCYYIIKKDHPMLPQIRKKHTKNIIVLTKKMRIDNLHIFNFFKFLRMRLFLTAWGYEKQNLSLHNFLYNNKYVEYVFLRHGVTLLKSFIFDIYSSTVFNKILVSNNIESDMVKKYMGYKDEQLIKVTLPRFDLLKNEKAEQKSIMFFPTWRLSFTRIDYKTSKYYEKINSLMKNQKLCELLNKYDIKLNLGLHHGIYERNSDFCISKNIQVISPTEVGKYIKSSSLLITDYSSIWSDFFFLEKPVIFYRFDYNDNNLIEKDKNDLEFAKQSDDLLFNVCYEEDQVIALIKKYIQNNFLLEEENKKIASRFFYCKNDIRKNILKELGID